MSELLRRIDRLFDSYGSVRAVALLRLGMGPIVLLHLAPFLSMMGEGRYYGDFFYDPWFDWYPEVSREVWYALLIACAGSALLLSAGLYTRVMAALTFGIVAYNFFLSETFFRHNRQFMLVFLGGLALVDSGRVYSLDAWRRSRPDEFAPLWALWLWRFMAAAPYAASGFSKLIDNDWWAGIITWDRVLRYRAALDASPVPAPIVDRVVSYPFHLGFAKVAIFTELFVAAALWFRRTRDAAIFVALMFHLTIEFTARVQVFSWMAILGTLIWVTPKVRDRRVELRLDRGAGRLWRRLIPRLDWLHRFVVTEVQAGPSFALIDRDGRRYEGVRAVCLTASRLPVLAPLFLPTLIFGVAWLWERVGHRARVGRDW